MSRDEPQNDPASPNIVWAKAPPGSEAAWLRLLVVAATVRAWRDMGGAAKVAEYVGLVHGHFGFGGPPNSDGLLRPTGIYRGLKRPLHTGKIEIGHRVLIYVTEPAHNYTYQGTGGAADFPRIEPIPLDSVFTTFVSLDSDVIDAARTAMPRAAVNPIDGVVLFWEWTVAPSAEGPDSFDRRYGESLL